LYRKDTDYALIMGRINGVFACFLSILSLSFYGFRKFCRLMERSVFHTNFIHRLAQGGGELSIFWAGNARPAADGKALSTL